MYTDKEIENLMFTLESDQKVFEFVFRQFPIYSVLRFTIEIYIRETKKLIAQSSLTAEADKIIYAKPSIITRALNKLKSFTSKPQQNNYENIYDPFNKIKTAPILFVCTSDLKDINNYSIELRDEIAYCKKKKVPINFVTPHYSNGPLKSPDFDYFGGLSGEKNQILNEVERRELNSFLKFIGSKINIDFSGCINQWSYTLSFFDSLCVQLSEVIKRSHCKYVICRSAYTEPWVAMACKKDNVKLIEVQHGVVTSENVYYNSTSKENANKLILPDFIFVLGREWKDILLRQKFIYTDENVKVVGTTDYMKERQLVVSEIKRVVIAFPPKKYSLLDISDIVLDYLSKNKDNLKNIELILRPHPIDGVESLAQFEEFRSQHLKFSNPQVESFKSVILNCDVLVSVISMCLYEALSYGKAVLSPGKYKGQTIDKGIKYFNTTEELHKLINSECSSQQKIEYLSPLNLSVLDNFLAA